MNNRLKYKDLIKCRERNERLQYFKILGINQNFNEVVENILKAKVKDLDYKTINKDCKKNSENKKIVLHIESNKYFIYNVNILI